MHHILEEFIRKEQGRLMGALVKQLGDFELAEEAIQEALIIAMEKKEIWKEGIPDKFFSWIFITAKRKAIDIIRRENLGRYKTAQLATKQEGFFSDDHVTDFMEEQIPDERLGLLFTCCHPVLGEKAQVALTLKSVLGFQIKEIAKGLLVKEATVSQTLMRAKKKIREAGIPFATYKTRAIPERLESVLSVLYLIFNEGYSPASGHDPIRNELCEEAISLTKLLVTLQKDEPEALGLLALMLYHHSRRKARLLSLSDPLYQESQRHSHFDQSAIDEATDYLKQSFQITLGGYYQTQAHIASLHAQVSDDDINWHKIVFLYEVLLTETDSPVIQLNYAQALIKVDRRKDAEEILFSNTMVLALKDYFYYQLACGSFLEQKKKIDDAKKYYQKSLSLTQNKNERMYVKRLISKLHEQNN